VSATEAGSGSIADVAFDWLAQGRRRRPQHEIGRPIPTYLSQPYGWAYVSRRNARLLDNDAVVNVILLGNHRRLRRALLSEVRPGQHVLHAAHVYGGLIPELASRIGSRGSLDVIDLVPLQAALCRRKLRGHPHTRVRVADATEPGEPAYDVACAFFLLHEIPDEQKQAVVSALVGRVVPGGKVVFVDYHRPALWHPLRPAFRRMFARFEPYAESLWRHDVRDFADGALPCRWGKSAMFGGLYQKVVARRC
jgi:SAM-dependent methyltransferase